MKTNSRIVIGAGISGINAATHLATAGFHVTVLEKNPHPGGCCDHFIHDGHHFDRGSRFLSCPTSGDPTGIHDIKICTLRDPVRILVLDGVPATRFTQEFRELVEQGNGLEEEMPVSIFQQVAG